MDELGYKASTLDIEFKADANHGNGRIEGYAATFGNFDLMGEAIAPGAFAEYMDEFKSHGFLDTEHSWRQGKPPLGMLVDAFEDKTGLYTVLDFHGTPRAQEQRQVAQERKSQGKSVRFSVGMRIKQKERTKEGVIIRKALPFEVSLTNVPINPMAVATSIKSDLLGGLTREAHHAEVLAALALIPDYLARERDVIELREKSGRKISHERRERLSALMERIAESHKELAALLEETEHKAPEDEARKAFANFLFMEARHKGIFTNG